MIIYMTNVEDDGDSRQLFFPLPLKNMDGTDGYIPSGFIWDGSSVPFIFQGIFPRHNHPIASCRHDYRCQTATSKAERKFADVEFEKDVGTTSWWITKKVGYLGVRVGAFFGIGSNF
jgi:hypothetical protein